jgi:hypothetical protein
MNDDPRRSPLRFLISIALLLLIGGSVWWMFGKTSPQIVKPTSDGHWLEPYIRANSTIDVAAAFHATCDISDPDHDNLLIDLLTAVGPKAICPEPNENLLKILGLENLAKNAPFLEIPEDDPKRSSYDFDDQLKLTTKKPWRDQEAPLIAAWLQRNQSILDRFERNTSSRCAIPWIQVPNNPTVPCLCLLYIRTLANAYTSQSFRAIASGDVKTAVTKARFLRNISFLISANRTLIDRMIATDILNQSLDIAQHLICDPSLDLRTIESWKEKGLSEPPSVVDALNYSERLQSLNIAQTLKDEGDFDSSVVCRIVNDTFDRLVWASSANTNSELKARSSAADQEFQTMLKECKKLKGAVGYARLILGGSHYRRTVKNKTLGMMILAMSIPNIIESANTINLCTARIRMTALAICLQLFCKRTGTWPDSISEMLGHECDSLPVDPFCGQPLHYEKNADGWRIWSVGRDANDDNGKPKSDDCVLNLR